MARLRRCQSSPWLDPRAWALGAHKSPNAARVPADLPLKPFIGEHTTADNTQLATGRMRHGASMLRVRNGVCMAAPACAWRAFRPYFARL